jgi:hypothetical protein
VGGASSPHMDKAAAPGSPEPEGSQHTVRERQERWKTMPTDHAPELAALGKRLADAKEFL